MNRSPRRPGDPLLGVSWQRLTTKQGALASIKSDFFGGGGGHLYFFTIIMLLYYYYIFIFFILLFILKFILVALSFLGLKAVVWHDCSAEARSSKTFLSLWHSPSGLGPGFGGGTLH